MDIKYWKKQSLDTQREKKSMNCKLENENPKIKEKANRPGSFCKGRMGLDPHKYNPFRILPFDKKKIRCNTNLLANAIEQKTKEIHKCDWSEYTV